MGHARDYANATKLSIKLDMSGNRIKVVVEDDGRGFDAEAVFGGDEPNLDARSQGLVMMKEKFELVRGSISVFSSETDGTVVRLELPASEDV
jgi:signal transduction histidine kinase